MISQDALNDNLNNEKNIALIAFHYNKLPCEIRRDYKRSQLAEAMAAINYANEQREKVMKEK